MTAVETLSSTVTAKPVVFAVDPDILKKAHAKLKTVVYKRAHTPPLRSIHADAAEGRVTFTATDIDRTMTVTVDATVDTPGAMLVPSDLFEKVFKIKPVGDIKFVAGEDTREVRSGRLGLDFNYTDPDEFPPIRPVDGRTVELNMGAIADVLPAASLDDARPILTGIHIDAGKYAATDSYRIHAVHTATDTGGPFLVPRDAAVLAVKYGADKAPAVISDRDIKIQLDADTVLQARLIEGDFPRYEMLIPKDQPHELVFTDDFKVAVTEARKIVPDTKDETLTVDSHGDGLRLRLGIAKLDTAGTIPFPIRFNPKYFAGILDGFNANRLGVTDALKPVAGIEPADEFGDGATRIRIVMPVRIN